MTLQRMSREGIDGDLRPLSDRHVGELCLLIVRNHPDVGQGGEGRDLTACAHQLSGLDLTLSDHTVLGRRDRGVAEIDPRGIECRALCRDSGLAALRNLRFQGTASWRSAASACARFCASCAITCARSVSSFSLVSIDEDSRREEPALPRYVASVLFERRCSGSDYRTCRRNIRELQIVLCNQRLRLRQCGRDAGFRLLDRGAIVIVNQLRKNLALVHTLVILNRKLTPP